MSSGRRSARRQAVFVLYQQDLLSLSAESALERAYDEGPSEYTRRLVLGVGAQRDRIDGLLARHLAGWELGRLGILERSILRVAAYELLAEPDVPEAVVIDQAVELAKRFCSGEAGSLVNGVLGSAASEMSRTTGEPGAEEKDGD